MALRLPKEAGNKSHIIDSQWTYYFMVMPAASQKGSSPRGPWKQCLGLYDFRMDSCERRKPITGGRVEYDRIWEVQIYLEEEMAAW